MLTSWRSREESNGRIKFCYDFFIVVDKTVYYEGSKCTIEYILKSCEDDSMLDLWLQTHLEKKVGVCAHAEGEKKQHNTLFITPYWIGNIQGYYKIVKSFSFKSCIFFSRQDLV